MNSRLNYGKKKREPFEEFFSLHFKCSQKKNRHISIISSKRGGKKSRTGEKAWRPLLFLKKKEGGKITDPNTVFSHSTGGEKEEQEEVCVGSSMSAYKGERKKNYATLLLLGRKKESRGRRGSQRMLFTSKEEVWGSGKAQHWRRSDNRASVYFFSSSAKGRKKKGKAQSIYHACKERRGKRRTSAHKGTAFLPRIGREKGGRKKKILLGHEEKRKRKRHLQRTEFPWIRLKLKSR